MSDTIKFYKGEETGIVHESYSDISTSLFKDQYLKALNEIGAYLNEANNPHSHNDLNNIFAFIGDRGTGKTSCMESVAQILMDIDENTKLDNIDEKVQDILAKKDFYILDIIDPTKFDDKVNILEVVMGMLFESFKKKIKCQSNKPCDEKDEKYEISKQRLLDSFQKVKDCLKFINNPKLFDDEDDDISRLDDMASVSKLKDLIGDLTRDYLLFFSKDILVLKIDDIDLQTSYAYQMVEQIRKYFIHKNVVILMAAKMDQLNKVVELVNTKKYSLLMGTGRIDSTEIMSIATKYLAKLVPTNHRVVLPVFEIYANSKLQYLERGINKNGDRLIDSWSTVKYAITNLIFQKTRFLFYHTKGEVSPIVPRNLRELRHLFALLVEMQDYNTANPNLRNKTSFLDYFYDNWVTNNIDKDDVKIVEEIRKVRDASRINKVVLQHLKNKYQNTLLSNLDEGQEQIPEILNERNVPYNISIADVLVVTDYIKRRINQFYDRMLIFFIESYYSITLYQFYDRLTEQYQKTTEVSINKDEFEGMIDSNIRKPEVVDSYNDYERLVAGRFINTDYFTLLPAESGNGISRDHRRISLEKLRNDIDKVIKTYIEKKTEPTEEELKIVHIVEFFALCNSRVLDSTRDYINKKYRLFDYLYYDYSLDSSNKYIQFDLGSFFFNIANVKRAYDRIHYQLFEFASKVLKESLYQKLLKACAKERRQGISREHALVSCACIRNYEVLTDFVNQVQHDWKKRSPNYSNTDNMITFFNRVGGYNISTYDKSDYNFDDKCLNVNLKKAGIFVKMEADELTSELNEQAKEVPYKISFAYANVISDVLKNIGEDLFNTVFAPTAEDVKEQPEQEKKVLQVFDVDAIMTYLPRRNEISLNVFLRRVRECCDPIFRNNRELTQKWYHLPIFEVERARKKISRDNARVILIKFKNDNNL